MCFELRVSRRLTELISSALSLLIVIGAVRGQNPVETKSSQQVSEITARSLSEGSVPATSSAEIRKSFTVSRYFDPLQGSSSDDLVRRALATNGELLAARLDIEKARARLRQARLRPNPTLDFEQTTGRFTGAAGERETSIGLAIPLEMGGKRKHRIQLAQAELEASEAEIADRERKLANEVRGAYAEALALLRELEITQNLNDIDLQTARFVQTRVNEGESAPIELSLLRVEVVIQRMSRRLRHSSQEIVSNAGAY